ncbi:MAG: hypothetical protein K2J70_04515, partial [Muribaculaceae bacterium]|nr:hypothetical protein [Muribaculaceae bacterium]
PMPEDIVDGGDEMSFSYSVPNYTGPSSAKAAPGRPNETDEAGDRHNFDPDTFWIDVKFPYGECQGYYAEVNGGRITLSPSLSNSSGADIPDVDRVKDSTRFFNLQGIEIKAPRKGEACIEVTGNKTRKIIL